MYDPIHNYLVQAEQSLKPAAGRKQPALVEYGYGLVLSQVLQLKVNPALESLQQLVQEDGENPYAHAYRSFVNLLRLSPQSRRSRPWPRLWRWPLTRRKFRG